MLFTSELKVAIITQGYAFLLCVTNWRFEKTYDRGVGLQLSAIDLRFMGAVTGLVLSIICFRRIWTLVRRLLANGIRVSEQTRIWGRPGSLLLLFPMLIGFRHTSSKLIDSDVLQMTYFTYGGAPSFFSVVMASLAILSFQAVVNLECIDVAHYDENSG